MSKLEDYANKYRTIRMERLDGILQMTLHTDGGPLRTSPPTWCRATACTSSTRCSWA
jgi:hypothetical protein